MEIWKNIDDNGLYQVSNFGRVKSFRKGKPRIMRQTYHKDYLVVSIFCKYKVVHRLVAESFIDNDNNLPLVDHINGDRKNNKVDNLRWVSHEDNNKNRNTKRDVVYPKFNQNELDNETWVKIPFHIFNVDGLEISNLGRIKKPYKIANKQGKFGGESITSYGASEKNYCDVKKNKNRKKLHCLVWECFNGPIPKGLQVNHIDNDKVNNRLSNLELITPSENIKHNYKTGNINTPDFYSNDKVLKVLELYYNYFTTTTEIEDILRIDRTAQTLILKGKLKYQNQYSNFYQKYDLYVKIQYYMGRIKQIKNSESFKYYDKVWELKNNGISYRKGSELLGITLDTFRTCIRAKLKIEKNETIIDELKKRL